MSAIVEKFGRADFHEQPWKNGGGTTCELLRAVHPSDPGKFAWRVSCATVAASGPFSIFPAIDRTLMLLDGDGFGLRCGSAPEVVLAERGQRIHFSGDLPTDCRLLGGPARDFNLMVDRALFRSEVGLLQVSGMRQLPAVAPLTLLYVLQGAITLSEPGLRSQTLLATGELGRLQSASGIRLEAESSDSLVVKVDLLAVTPPA